MKFRLIPQIACIVSRAEISILFVFIESAEYTVRFEIRYRMFYVIEINFKDERKNRSHDFQ